MLRYSRFPVTSLYPVEISGWDGKEEFFVEHCELEWNEDSGKQIVSKADSLNDHRAVLLVRLLQTDGFGSLSHPSQPVAYGAERVKRGKTKSGSPSIPAQQDGSPP